MKFQNNAVISVIKINPNIARIKASYDGNTLLTSLKKKIAITAFISKPIKETITVKNHFISYEFKYSSTFFSISFLFLDSCL